MDCAICSCCEMSSQNVRQPNTALNLLSVDEGPSFKWLENECMSVPRPARGKSCSPLSLPMQMLLREPSVVCIACPYVTFSYMWRVLRAIAFWGCLAVNPRKERVEQKDGLSILWTLGAVDCRGCKQKMDYKQHNYAASLPQTCSLKLNRMQHVAADELQ